MPDPTLAVAVTGIGVVSPIGIGSKEYWRALCAGASGVRAIESFPVPADGPRLAAELRDFNARDFIVSSHLRRMDKLSRMVVAASRLALTDGALDVAPLGVDRVAVVIGSGFGNTSETDRHLERVYTKGPAAASPLIFPNLVLNAPASYAAMELGLTGANLTIAQGETSGEQAIMIAVDLIRQRRADAVLAGGGDEVSRLAYDAYREVRGLSGQRSGREWSSPYDSARNGVVLGEAAAVLLLEPLDRARARRARIYAEIESYASFSVRAPLYDWPSTAPDAVTPIRRMLAERDINSSAIGLVCGAANSSLRLDACELHLFGELFDDAATRIASIKGATGEIAAAGALTAASACLALDEQCVPPLSQLENPPPTALRLAGRRGEPALLERALTCTIARGGAGAALLLRRARD